MSYSGLSLNKLLLACSTRAEYLFCEVMLRALYLVRGYLFACGVLYLSREDLVGTLLPLRVTRYRKTLWHRTLDIFLKLDFLDNDSAATSKHVWYCIHFNFLANPGARTVPFWRSHVACTVPVARTLPCWCQAVPFSCKLEAFSVLFDRDRNMKPSMEASVDVVSVLRRALLFQDAEECYMWVPSWITTCTVVKWRRLHPVRSYFMLRKYDDTLPGNWERWCW